MIKDEEKSSQQKSFHKNTDSNRNGVSSNRNGGVESKKSDKS